MINSGSILHASTARTGQDRRTISYLLAFGRFIRRSAIFRFFGLMLTVTREVLLGPCAFCVGHTKLLTAQEPIEKVLISSCVL